MRSQTRLLRRKTTKFYYFRARVPADPRLHYNNRREIVESLKTTDKREAERLVRIKSVEPDNHFEELRRREAAATRTKISNAEIARIVAKATATRMKADEEGRILGLTEKDFQRHLKWLEEAEAGGAHRHDDTTNG